MDKSIDILMITYNRPQYTQLSLGKLLEACNDNMRVWVWHNGADKETLKVVKTMREHPRFYKFHHSIENKKLNEPTNWLWQNAEGDYLSKVDDDCLVPNRWAETLSKAHQDIPELGVIGSWRFMEEDFVPELASRKIQSFPGGHSIMRNCWVEGSGYLMKRECYVKLGPLKNSQSFPGYCIQLAKLGYVVGWYYPFLYQEHLDDPRCHDSLLKHDEDMKRWAPLSAINNGVVTIDAWQAQLKRSAQRLQTVSFDPKYFTGWRRLLRLFKGRIRRSIGIKQQW